jgi:hypothetical protein
MTIAKIEVISQLKHSKFWSLPTLRLKSKKTYRLVTMRTKEQAPLRAAPFKPGDLMDAVINEDIVKSRDLLVLCQTKEHVDDVDSEGRTTLMAAARGNGEGRRMYADLLAMIWERCKALGCDKKNILLEQGGRQTGLFLCMLQDAGTKRTWDKSSHSTERRLTRSTTPISKLG